MPSLVEHYREHLQETPGLSVLVFLGEHYLNVQHRHQNDAHTQLPLHCSHIALAESALPQALPFVMLSFLPDPSNRSSLPSSDAMLLSSDHASGLFRPPIQVVA